MDVRLASFVAALAAALPEVATAADSPKSARAAGAGTGRSTGEEVLDRIIDRPHTVAELEAGIIALPNAPISQGQRGGDTPLPFVEKIGRGDATMQTGIHVLYRWSRSYA